MKNSRRTISHVIVFGDRDENIRELLIAGTIAALSATIAAFPPVPTLLRRVHRDAQELGQRLPAKHERHLLPGSVFLIAEWWILAGTPEATS